MSAAGVPRRSMSAAVEDASRWRRLVVVLAVPMLLFLLGALAHRDVPGAYMDAVNPDYMVTGLLYPGRAVTPYWVLPGSLLGGVWPVVGQVYHGALRFYLGLPAYALFGTGLDGIRIANAGFGLVVLAGAGAFLLAFRVRAVVAALALCALALDPGFVFAFRTQFYITLLPIGLVLASAALVERGHGRRMVVLAGLLAGLSVWGYFIYLFLVPALAVQVVVRRRSAEWAWWVAGLALGGSPYLIGFVAMLVATGGWAGFMAFMSANLATLAVHSTAAMPLTARVGLFVTWVGQTLADVGPASMMLHEVLPERLFAWKVAVVVAVPAVALVVAVVLRRREAGALLVLAGLVAGVALLVLTFGDRLWLHHPIMLIVILYVAAGVALDGLAGLVRAPVWLTGLAVLPLLFGNAVDRQSVFERLEATGGVGLASDAIVRFGLAAASEPSKQMMFLPDWGVFMPFVMVTEARIAYSTDFTPEAARAAVCAGQDAVLATTADQWSGKPAERLVGWRASLPWTPETSVFRQRDGVAVLEVTRWRGLAGGC